jgi:phosphoribosyl-ATP pyrophosphohydrolase/phosphoribosyl-AMP cyclohydrolase
MTKPIYADLKFDERGLIPAVVQEVETGRVLMVAYMNKESIEKTMETRTTWFYSRSRQRLWNKGETSGNTQRVVDIAVDCDGDSLLVIVEQKGPACHTGQYSCFFTDIDGEQFDRLPAGQGILTRLYQVIEDRRDHPQEGSYTNYLFDKGLDKILKKIGEEAAEVIIAAKNSNDGETVYEIADLVYHLTVLMVKMGIGYRQVFDELASRHGNSHQKKS